MYRTILVPLDGSPFGEQALPVARNIARWADATLNVCHVHTAPITAFINGAPIVAQEEAVREADERAYLTAIAQRQAGATDAAVTTTLLDEGLIADALANHALVIQADLIVMTTHGRGAMSRFWLGSVADQLLRQTPRPVLLIRPTQPPTESPRDPTFAHILIPLDGSQAAEQIIDHALALGSLAHAHYTLLQVIDPMMAIYISPPAAVRPDERMIHYLRTNAQSYLDGVAAQLHHRGVEVETKVVLGSPAPTILSYAEEHTVDLIAMGTHGRSGVGRMLLGSVADKVLRAACVPLLLHRPEHEAAHHKG